MSVLEDLRAVEQRLVARLEELRPLVEEYEELKRTADRLGIDVNRRATARSRSAKKAPARATPSGRRRPGGTRATGAERRERVLALIAARPGITVREMSEEMGVDAPQIYRVVRKLQSEGRIKKEGARLSPA
jgi:Winged helix-turn-helix DNA-binding